MKIRRFSLLFAIILSLSHTSPAQTRVEDRTELTTIQAPWVVSIPSQDLDIQDIQAKPDQKSAYFLLHSASSGLNVSMFIEPVDKCKTSEECRDFVLDLGNPAWGKFQNLVKSKIGDFSYFEFFRPEVQDKPVKILDFYAEYVGRGFWVDLHISKALYKNEDRPLFENFIRSIHFITKGGKPDLDLDGPLEKGKKSVGDWLALWDQTKCRESYSALSSNSRVEVVEKQWIDYCERKYKEVGKSKSRKLIATSVIRSLPGKTESPVAVLAYQVDFENRKSVVEIVSLMLEKDGKWSVTNYLTQ